MAWLRQWLSGKWQTPAGYALGCVMALSGGLLAIPVSAHVSPPVAVGACMAGLLLALASAAGFVVIRRKSWIKRNNWLLAAPLALGLSFSLFLALVEGWNTQISFVMNYVLPGLVAVVVLVMVVWGVVIFARIWRASRRIQRAAETSLRERGVEIAHEGLFREDGERIVVYANRGALVRQTLTQIVVVAALVGGYLWACAVFLIGFGRIAIGLGIALFVALVLLILSLTLVRIMRRGPTLVVNADGITDDGSMIATGRGQLRWNEILKVQNTVQNPSTYPRRYRSAIKTQNGAFDIILTDFSVVTRRQPLWKRALGAVTGGKTSWGPRLYSGLLDRPAAALVAQINAYIRSHAPEASWHRRRIEEDVEADEETDEEADAGE